MIPFGPFRPDAAGLNVPVTVEARNCKPAVNGFAPFKQPQPVSTNALGSRCLGAVTVILEDGSHSSFAGDSTRLYQLGNDRSWSDVSELEELTDDSLAVITDDAAATIYAGGQPYSTPSGERWRFEVFGDTLVATNFIDDPRKFVIGTSSVFELLGGTPPKARYIAVVRDFLVLGCLSGFERMIHWSTINNIEQWLAGTGSGDTQEFPSGGPVRGIIGGEFGYIFQAEKVQRMTFIPGSAEVFAFDEIEGARGLAAANSLVKLGNSAFYFGGDGFYRMDLGSGGVQPIGVGKWRDWFLGDYRSGTELELLGGIEPSDQIILWAYISHDNSTAIPDRVVIYNWALDEATFADVTVEAMANWISQGYTLDTMNSFGSLDELPYSLDSPFWRGSGSLLGLFGSDHKLSHLQGQNLEATLITSDGQADSRMIIKGTRPHIDTTSVQVAVSMRERDGDNWAFPALESMEDTGEIPAWTSGNVARAKIVVAEGADWARAKGLKTIAEPDGLR